MTNRILPTLKLVVLVFTIVLALIAILYVLDVLSGELLGRVVLKIMAVMGILIGASLIAILLTGNQTKQ
jgi:hypothetical protein